MISKSAKAVIGAGYGDEGKGLLTDLLASASPDSVVVRSNGSAQAGHTVVAPNGSRHVFHHVGSGALAGVPTHLSAYFVAHPMMLLDEWEVLRGLGANMAISSDPRAMIATPFDMMINQAAEMARSADRHGSCGLGFGETIERNRRPEFAISTRDLFRPDLAARLHHIWSDWVPERLSQIGIASLPDSITTDMQVERLIFRFLADCEAYLERVALWPDSRLAEKGAVIFEGAQGLMLDQDFGAFPYVTRSNTGLRNMLSIAAEAGIESIEAIYVTRCYATRHGAGPLAHEVKKLYDINVQDPTNVPNAWQGNLRFAPLDTAVLRKAISSDLRHQIQAGPAVRASLAVTCLDQANQIFALQDGETTRHIDRREAAGHIASNIGLPLFGECWGPSRNFYHKDKLQAECA